MSGRSHAIKRQRVERSPGRGYEVLGFDVMSPIFPNRLEAERWLRAQQAALPASRREQTRPCITCGEEFTSQGAHNRMCDPCRAAARNDSAFYGLAFGPSRSVARRRAGNL